MTSQEIFNTVHRHLLKQNQRAMRPAPTGDGHEKICAYRSEDGMLRCAVGCLIPDDKYNSAIENATPEKSDSLYNAGAVALHFILHDIGITDEHIPLLKKLQATHDSWVVESWPWRLNEVASEFGLRIPPVETGV